MIQGMLVECQPHPNYKQRMLIVCDEDSWREIHTTIFGKAPSLPKNCSSLDEFHQKFQVLEYNQAKLYAIKRLSLQSMPSTTLSKALRDRLVSEETTERLIQEFIQLGYLNDAEWTKSFVRQQSAKKMGPRAIAQKLAFKGLPKEEVEAALGVAKNPSQQKESIVKLLSTRYRQRNLTDYKERQKVAASLMRRGFDFSIILDCLRERGHSMDDMDGTDPLD